MKTSKQKCLEMWEWLALNPVNQYGELTDKDDYFFYLKKQKRSDEFSYCWACFESEIKSNKVEDDIGIDCRYCPIKWESVTYVNTTIDSDQTQCTDDGSSYLFWWITNIPEERKKHAAKIVKLIKETWKE